MRIDKRACRQTVRTDMTKRTIAFPNLRTCQKFYILWTDLLYVFVWAPGQAAIISLYCINRQVFITETEFVYCAVKTDSLNIIQVNFRL